jgi:Glycosyl transferase family 2
MPAYNAGRFIIEAVESVLTQEFRDLEMIVVDDNSSDDTRALLATIPDQRVRILSQTEHRGQAAALNVGLEAAGGEFVAIHDADDVSRPRRLGDQVRAFEKSRELVLIGSTFELIDEAGTTIGRKLRPTSDTDIRWHLLFMNPFAHSSVMFRRSLLLRHADLRYDARFGPALDYDLWSRMLQHGRGANLVHPLVKYRIHAEQMLGPAHPPQANEIGAANMRELGLNVTAEDMLAVRDLWLSPPRALRDGEGVAAAILTTAAIRFHSHGTHDRQTTVLRRRTLLKILVCLRHSAPTAPGRREMLHFARALSATLIRSRKQVQVNRKAGGRLGCRDRGRPVHARDGGGEFTNSLADDRDPPLDV